MSNLTKHMDSTLQSESESEDSEVVCWITREEIDQILLFRAVKDNDEGKVDSLITKAGVDVSVVDEGGRTPLMYAVKGFANENVANALIQAGSYVNVSDHEGKTALHFAASQNNPRLPSVLIQAGADVNVADIEGRTALHYAVENDNTTTAMIDDDDDDDEEKEPLYDVVSNDKESVISVLFEAGADANITDNDSKTPLFYAVTNNENMVNKLIKAGADVNVTDNEGKTPLFHAVSNQFIVRALIKDGSSNTIKGDIYGRTALFYAVTKSFSSARYILDDGRASLHVKDNCAVSILSFFIEDCIFNESYFYFSSAILSRHMSEGLAFFMEQGLSRKAIFKALMDAVFCKSLHQSTPNIYTYDARPLSVALTLAKDYISKINLAKKRAIKKVLTMIRETPRLANENMFISLASNTLDGLVELGANPNSSDSDGNTALHCATRLPFYGISKATVIYTCQYLIKLGVLVNTKNHQNETPLLFCLSREVWNIAGGMHQWSGVKSLIDVCQFLVKRSVGSSVEDISRSGDSVFHLVFEIFQKGFHLQGNVRKEDALNDSMKLLQIFLNANVIKGITVNKRDLHLNTPLHLWASLELSADEYSNKYCRTNEFPWPRDYAFELLTRILKQLLKCGAKLNDRNENEETPLHLCRTWTAVKLLIEAGARPNDVDSSGRSPLLSAAAKNKTFLLFSTERFYPDVLLSPKAFWKTALENGLDPWTVDQHGECVLSILIEYKAFILSEALVDVADEENFLQCDTIAVALLNAICKDASTRAYWKSNFVEKILKSRKSHLPEKQNEDSPLHFCCRNIVKTSKTSFDYDDVHLMIAKQLVLYGADCQVPDATGMSCLDIADTCPVLKVLLKKPVDVNKVPLLIPWTSVSEAHEHKLAQVARRQQSKYIKPYWYHENHLQSGSFGVVFAGINEKDGREVAIKRIEKLRMQRPEDKREITNLTALADSEQIVRYLYFFEDENFSYVVLELMEGNLDEYLDGPFDSRESVTLCRDVVHGLKYLHDQNILHRDIKPTNILFRIYPKLCLKIADFGLSRRIDSTSFSTVISTNVGTKCWIAPEVLKSTSDHSTLSDIFACGLVLHYILLPKRHPFYPVDCCNKSPLQCNNETENNIINDDMVAWGGSLCPETTDILKKMLGNDECRRPTAAEVVAHPLFWSKRKKTDLLIAVGNQKPEFTCPRGKRSTPLTAVETDLESSYSTIVGFVTWNDTRYLHIPVIYAEMVKKRAPYDTCSIVELVRFIRNAYAHVTATTSNLLLEDYVFLDYFPNLVMEVFKAVTIHGWHQTRKEIVNVINNGFNTYNHVRCFVFYALKIPTAKWTCFRNV